MQVIVLSGYADFEYARQAIKYGVTEYLLKPVDETSLGESIQACIDRIAQQRDLVQEENVSKRVIAYINAHYQEDIFLDKLAEEFNFSTKYLSSLVKNETGKSFSTYLTDLRLDRAIDLLLHTDLGIKEIAASVGYSDPRYFHRLFKKHVGKTPPSTANSSPKHTKPPPDPIWRRLFFFLYALSICPSAHAVTSAAGDEQHHRQPEGLEQEQHQAGELGHAAEAGQKGHQHKAQNHRGVLDGHHQAHRALLLHAGGDHVHHGLHPALGGHQRVRPGDLLPHELARGVRRGPVQHPHRGGVDAEQPGDQGAVTLGSVVRTSTLMPLSSSRWSSFFRRRSAA